MNEQSFVFFLKAYFVTFFVKLPLLTLALMPMFFVLYGGEFHKFSEIVKQLVTPGNGITYFGVLIISYFGQAIYGWTQAKN